MAEIAGCREERRFPVLIAAIAWHRLCCRQRLLDACHVGGIEREFEQALIVGAMLALAEPRADDHGGDCRLLHDPARGDVRDRNAVLAGNHVQGRKQGLQDGPAADDIDEALVLRLAPIRDLGWLGSAVPSVGEEAACKRAIGEQPDAVLEAERAHRTCGAPVEQRERDLVGDDRYPMLHDQAQVIGIEVGDAKLADDALLA